MEKTKPEPGAAAHTMTYQEMLATNYQFDCSNSNAIELPPTFGEGSIHCIEIEDGLWFKYFNFKTKYAVGFSWAFEEKSFDQLYNLEYVYCDDDFFEPTVHYLYLHCGGSLNPQILQANQRINRIYFTATAAWLNNNFNLVAQKLNLFEEEMASQHKRACLKIEPRRNILPF